MGRLRFRNGVDTWLPEKFPTTSHGTGKFLLLADSASGARSYVLVSIPMSGIAGRTIVSASLSVTAHTNIAAQQLTVRRTTGPWLARNATWRGDRFNASDSSVLVNVPFTPAGERLVLPVDALVSEVAAGAAHYGFRITTNTSGSQRLKGFSAGEEGWLLEVETSEVPDVPSGLWPDVGTVSTTKPVLRWVFDDAGIEDSQQTGFRVQVDPNANGASPAFASPIVDSSLPQYALAGSTFSGLVSSVANQWRVQVRSEGGWSDWSDWAQMTYQALPTASNVSPVDGSDLYDPTPTVTLTSSKALRRYRVFVNRRAGGGPAYASGWLQGGGLTTVEHTIPFRQGGRTIFGSADSVYDIEVHLEDQAGRVGTPGFPGYRVVKSSVTFRSGGSSVTAAVAWQVGSSPLVKVQFSRASAAASWVIEDNGVKVAVLEHDDPDNDGLGPVVQTQPGTWEWVYAAAEPNTDHEIVVRARSDATGLGAVGPAKLARVRPRVSGLWLVAPDRSVVQLLNEEPGLMRTDRRTSHSPFGVGFDVDIVTAFEGWRSDSVTGVFDPTSPGSENFEAVLRAVKSAPGSEVRLVHQDVNFPAVLRDLWWRASDVFNGETIRRMDVSFGCFQSDEFTEEV